MRNMQSKDEFKKIRVLRIIARMNLGGPAIQITGLMRGLSPLQFEQRLITGSCDVDEVDYLDMNAIEINYSKIEGLGRSVNILSDLKALIRIVQEIRSYSPDIIHTHTAKAGLLGRIAAILSFKRQIRVHTFHGHLLSGYFGGFKTKLLISIEKLLARITNQLITVGINVRDELLAVKIGKLQNYTVIGPGLEIKGLPDRKSFSRLFNTPIDKFIVTWIGRVVPVKAPHRILEIATECHQRNLDVHFVVVGDGPLLSGIQTQATDLNLPITFLGWQMIIENILSFSDLVMLTSVNEGTPVALIQAQLASIPVLTSNVGSAAEVLVDGYSGYCLEYSAKSFADKIEFLANNPKVKIELGSAGEKNAKSKFSLDKLVSQHAHLYINQVNRARS